MARILVADDDRELVEFLTFLVKKDGHVVIPTYNGWETLTAVASQQPDLIILDVMMPGLDGYTLHARLLEDPDTRSIPVIVITGKTRIRDLFETSSNVVGYFIKPFDFAALREKIHEVLCKVHDFESSYVFQK